MVGPQSKILVLKNEVRLEINFALVILQSFVIAILYYVEKLHCKINSENYIPPPIFITDYKNAERS